VKRNKLIISLIGISLICCKEPFAYRCLPPTEIATLLGWTPTGRNLCGGYYQEPAIILACPNPQDLDAAPTTITAEHTVSFSAMGTSQLEGNVVVTQPGRKMTADKALLFRDPQSHEVSQLLLLGNVHYYESGKHVVSQQVFVDFRKKYVEVKEALYRLVRPTKHDVLNAWGQAESFVRKSDKDIILTHASYTTCPPIHPTWRVEASKIKIDREAGWGKATNTLLFIHDIPLIWLPYFSFPINKKRKTGFLFPTASYFSRNGLNIGLPYYFNLAPNYDLTLIPSAFFRRGANIESHFRFLTCKSCGKLDVEYIPYDRLFATFRKQAPYIYGVNPSTLPFLNRIEESSNGRGLLSFTDNTHFNSHWWGSLNLNYVTDDYYLQDFTYNPFNSTLDQLLNQAEINYASDNWRFLGRLQAYQTLHPINQQPTFNLYSRIPQLYLASDYPNLPFHYNYQINSEFVYFEKPPNLVTGHPFPTGARLHLQPSVDFPLIFPSSFLTPKFILDATGYDVKNPTHQTTRSRVLPIFTVDTGTYFERRMGNYKQTLEPRAFYLFVPASNQGDLPLFDTTLPPFSFAQLFRTNRFVGYDRLADANQLSLALTTRFINGFNGEQKIRASIGQILYIKRTKTCAPPSDCNTDFYYNKSLSPLVGEINYSLFPSWDVVGGMAIDPESYGLNTASLRFHYHLDPKHIFNIGYDFVKKGDTLTGYNFNSSHSDLNRVNLALAWQLTDHWQVLGNFNYNLSHGHPQAYFYGLQYDSCCYAVRFVASRIITAENRNDAATYQTNIYIQLQLKGLGNIGNSDAGRLLTSSIFGYCDTFKD
jgi:LPS-assembly protein